MTASNKHHTILSSLHDEISFYIEANEGELWPESITQDTPTFDKLLKLERSLERDVSGYLKDFADNRAERLVNWHVYERQARPNRQANEELMVAATAELVIDEQKILLNVVFSHLKNGELLGIEASSRNYHIPIDLLDFEPILQRQINNSSHRLVKNITETTRRAMQASLQTSLELGEHIRDAQARINKLVDNPVRARMIARTEAVNTYGNGTLTFGKQTGATGKVWDSVIDSRTSLICQELHQKYGSPKKAAKIDEPYTWSTAGGGSTDAPGAHVNCRSGHYLLYP